MDKKTLQELIKWLKSEEEEIVCRLIGTTNDTGANRRIGQLDMTRYVINYLESTIQKSEERS